MTAHKLTLKIRRKPAAPRRGISKAIAYRSHIFDPAGDMEAIIEAYGADTAHRLIDRIIELRGQLPQNAFVEIEVV